MSDTWYEARYVGPAEIRPVEIDKATDCYVWVSGTRRRDGRSTNWSTFFPSWDEAHDHLVKRQESIVRAAEATLHRAKSALGSIKSMKPSVVNGEKP